MRQSQFEQRYRPQWERLETSLAALEEANALDDFLAQVPEHFTKLTVPTKEATYDRGEGMDVLRRMFAAGEGDDGLVFHTSG